jgi:hypothetical protein
MIAVAMVIGYQLMVNGDPQPVDVQPATRNDQTVNQ